jgi:hypothetical protein
VFLCLVLAIMVAAGTASAEVYASLRVVGNGSFFLRGSVMEGGALEFVNDSGLYMAKEVATGFAVGPVVRHTWMILDDKIGIGPEVSLRYTTATSEIEMVYPDMGRTTITEDGPEYTAWDIDYSLRMDFFF